MSTKLGFLARHIQFLEEERLSLIEYAKVPANTFLPVYPSLISMI
jgi:hypothetical protein